MKMLGLRVFWLAFILFSASEAHAQIANGDFSGGTANWTWKQATTLGDCSTALAQFSPSASRDTPTDPFDSAHGRFALLEGQPQLAAGTWHICRQIEQQVVVPVASALSFEDEIATYYTQIQSASLGGASLTVKILNPATGKSATIFNKSVNSWMCSYNCNQRFLVDTADISQFWGQTVVLQFLGQTSISRTTLSTTVLDAPVHLDNVKFVPLTIDQGDKPTAGSWYNPSRSGHGIHLSKGQNGDYTLIWYTYEADGTPVWYISGAAPMWYGVWTSKLLKSTWNVASGTNVLTEVGDVRIEMTAAGKMNFLWDFYSVNGDNQGYDAGEPFVFLWGGQSFTGEWYEPSKPGWGLSIEYKNSAGGIDTVATAFYYDKTQPTWAQGTLEGTPTTGTAIELYGFKGTGLCPSCEGQVTSVTSELVGALSLTLDSARGTGTGWIDVSLDDGAVWTRGSSTNPSNLSRLTYP